MQRKIDKPLLLIRILTDLTMICLAWLAAYYLRFYSGLATPLGIPETILYFKLVPFIIGIWLGVFYFTGLYRRTGVHRSAFTEGLDILQVCVMATLTFIVFTYFYEEYRYSRITLLIFAVLHPLLLITGRSLIRKGLRYYRRVNPHREVLIIGGGGNISHTLQLIKKSGLENPHVAGVILVGGTPEDHSLCSQTGIEELPQPTDWVSFFSQYPVHSVYFALPHSHYPYLDQYLDTIADQVPDIKLVPDILRFTRFSAGIEMIDNTPVISIHDSPLAGSGAMLKRFVDLMGAAAGLIVLSPVLLILALLVRLSSPGPILFRQPRMGLDGRTFDCLKFRSMPIDAERKTGAIWATKSDNRATWIGRIMRRTSLDELPQLWNVLVGEMSLVGPRPERPVFVDQFRKKVPGYMLRHKVKTGMTGWAQVNGWRGDTSIEKRIECDLYYIQNWSIWLDFKIMIMTIDEIFRGRNAY